MSYMDTHDLVIKGKEIINTIENTPGSGVAAPLDISIIRRSTLNHMYEEKATTLNIDPSLVSLVNDMGFVDSRS